MRIIVFLALTLVVCSSKLVTFAMRSRDNFNVLVPNNDVNFHAKIKTLLNSDDAADPEDFTDNDIANLSQLRNSKIEKVLHKNTEELNKVHDDKNKNIEENEIDKDPQILNEYDITATIGIVGTAKTPVNNVTQTLPSRTTSLYNGAALNVSYPDTTTPHPRFTNPFQWTTSNFVRQENEASPTSVTNETTSVRTNGPITSVILPQTTPDEIYFEDLKPDECILGNADRYLKWVDNEGRLVENYIRDYDAVVKFNDHSYKFKNTTKYLEYARNVSNTIQFQDLTFLSLAYNNLDQLPHELMQHSQLTLEFLSLAGNDFSFTGLIFGPEKNLRQYLMLKHLDMRNCKLKSIWSGFLKDLNHLNHLILADNSITDLSIDSFPLYSLIHLDLSNNQDNRSDGVSVIPDGMKISQKTFINCYSLQTLDLSHTKIEAKSLTALSYLPLSLHGISLCYTQLSRLPDMKNSPNILFLDISGNFQLTYSAEIFTSMAKSLKYLHMRNSFVRNLDWIAPLSNLQVLNLFDNSINTLRNDSFMHMPHLWDLNLEKNSISNWYARIFTRNAKLEMLNLRNNKLTLLTNDMKEDFLNVRFLAIGGNEFECNCILQEFIHKLFETTKKFNFTTFLKEIYNDKLEEIIVIEDYETTPDTTQVSLVMRNKPRPEYDVISRTYQRYYNMIEKSVEALMNKKQSTKPTQKSLILKSSVESSSEHKTVLFDYDDDADDYLCINATAKRKQPVLDLIDLCETNSIKNNDNESSYTKNKDTLLVTLSISLPSVLALCCLLFLIYWKWWYVKYFFVLCKNSAILTFMDHEGSEAFAKGSKNDPGESFLYDVFVSYSEQNRDWVLDEFLPNVEKREQINVCLHERDFIVGYGILENIVSCMDRSRCLLLLISENFLLSQWCQFEMNLAQHRLIETRREKLIVVLLEDIPQRKQPKTLKYLMRTKTYIKWPIDGTAEQKQLFWKRLKKAIIASKWENENYGSIV